MAPGSKSHIQYLDLHRRLSELLYRHDPISLAAAGAPEDEYEPEVSTIIPRLSDARAPDNVLRIVHQEFLHWFGETAGPESAYKEIADEIWNRLLKHDSSG
jgi:hypothetical protein